MYLFPKLQILYERPAPARLAKLLYNWEKLFLGFSSYTAIVANFKCGECIRCCISISISYICKHLQDDTEFPLIHKYLQVQ